MLSLLGWVQILGGNNPTAQLVTVATDVLNDIFAIARLDFAAQAANGFLQGSRVVEFGVEPHNIGDFIVTEQSVIDQRLENFHFDEGNFKFLVVAVNAHPVLIENKFAAVQAIRFIEKRLD